MFILIWGSWLDWGSGWGWWCGEHFFPRYLDMYAGLQFLYTGLFR